MRILCVALLSVAFALCSTDFGLKLLENDEVETGLYDEAETDM